MPCLWLLLILVIKSNLPSVHSFNKLKHRASVKAWAFNCGVAWVVINLFTGVLEGFGRSPYDHSIKGILINTFVIGTALVGQEYVRNILIHTFGRRHMNKAIVGVTLLITTANIDWLKVIQLKTLKEFTIFCAQQGLPTLGHNLLATYLSAYGGMGSSSIYLGIVEAFEWVLPILPNTSWLTKGVIGIGVPVVCLSVLVQSYMILTKGVKPYKKEQEPIWKWIPSTLISIAFIWFVVGVFPIYPSAIVTGSMEPMIKPGDVVLIKKIQTEEDLESLKVGDVIAFKRDLITINHRILEIIDEEQTGLKLYQTKGDNNSAIDGELVKMEDVKGIIIKVVPKIGWPTLLLRSRDTRTMEQVEF